MSDTPRRKAPASARILEAWLQKHAETAGVPATRMRRRMSFMVIAGMLDRVRDAAEMPLFVLKGGVALELRFGLRARASRDYDAVFRDAPDAMLERLDQAFASEFAGFHARRGGVKPVGNTGAQRAMVKLTFRSRPWATVPVELGLPDPGVEVDVEELASNVDLTIFGLDESFSEVPVLSTSTQIAQKFHACTEVFVVGENKRVRDIPDILLLATLIEDMRQLRQRCEAIFVARNKHAWPPDITIYDSWRAGYPDLIAELENFPYADLDSAVEAVRSLIQEIDQSARS